MYGWTILPLVLACFVRFICRKAIYSQFGLILNIYISLTTHSKELQDLAIIALYYLMLNGGKFKHLTPQC